MKKDILIHNKQIYNFEYNFLVVFSFITKLTLFLFILGFINNRPLWLIKFNSIVKVFLGLFLIYRFNKYRKYKIEFTELDRKICYSVGMYIVLISFVDYVSFFTDTIRNYIMLFTKPVIDKIPLIDKI